ncbi:protein mono-ADP-ribosyltransferase PARP9 [Hypanus sabinus]|uniref:protein mono-ADP-ribosyltransferase PARP9 n=1 Tax=Hypanus sabinus TaxID=79690 RepID=UPI0028C4F0A3|nr:protein mono-ADP-ribosyltransferase PARP9 [Hypanus sabinus]
MAVSFPDGRSFLIVSWEENVHIRHVERILDNHFHKLAHQLHTNCELRSLGFRQVLVLLTKTTADVLKTIAANTSVPYKNEEIKLNIKIPLEESFTLDPKNLVGITEKVLEKHDEENIIGEHQIEDTSQQEMCIEIPLENDFVSFVEDNRDLLHEVIKMKFDCSVAICIKDNIQTAATKKSMTFNSVPIIKSLSGTTALPTGVRYMKILPEGFHVFVCLDHLAKHKVDAIVNIANEYLKHDHGVARALALQAGHEFEMESNSLVQAYGAVPVGTAVVTGGGHLPCKKVIHAVGPVWNQYPDSECDRLLLYSIKNSLLLANELGMTSVAIPAVSSENGFPLQRCAELIVNAVTIFYSIWQVTDPLKQIHFVSSSEIETAAIENACNNIFAHTDQKHLPSNNFVPNSIRDIFKFQNLHLEIKRENIEEQNTDVIVNAISRDLNLDVIRVSKAIGEKAGPELQKELRRITKMELLPLGEVLKTSGFLLNCKYVYHVVFSPNTNLESEKFLKMVICRCLELAEEDEICSIAVPVTNDTKLSLHPSKMAKLFTETLMNFIELNQQSKLTSVYFVLHPEETEIYETFLQTFARHKQQSQGSPKLPSIIDSMPFLERDGRTERSIKLCGKDDPLLECAQYWINSTILSDQDYLIIENRNLIYFSEYEHQVLSALGIKEAIMMEETINEMNAFIELSGPHFEIVYVALHIELLLCNLQENMVQLIETQLLQSVVQWIYSTEDEINQYNATENFLLEKAFVDNKTLLMIKVNNTEQTIYLQRLIALNDQRDQFKVERLVQGVDYLKNLTSNWGPTVSSVFQKIPMEITSDEFKKRTKAFEDAGLTILKIEQIQNPVLWACYLNTKEKNKEFIQTDGSVTTLYHAVPSYFCNVVCRIGFLETYSYEHDKEYGDGIYFRNNLKNLMKRINVVGKIIHIFEAEVFIGNCNKEPTFHISQQLKDCDCCEYKDSIEGSTSKAFVILNSSRAYPHYLITCRL